MAVKFYFSTEGDYFNAHMMNMASTVQPQINLNAASFRILHPHEAYECKRDYDTCAEPYEASTVNVMHCVHLVVTLSVR